MKGHIRVVRATATNKYKDSINTASSPRYTTGFGLAYIMDRKVPVSPVHIQCLGVPPVLVEEAVSESQQLSGEVQPRVEHSVEHEQPDAGVGHC